MSSVCVCVCVKMHGFLDIYILCPTDLILLPFFQDGGLPGNWIAVDFSSLSLSNLFHTETIDSNYFALMSRFTHNLTGL